MSNDEILTSGTRFDDRYAILACIGAGSFGIVYSAFDHEMGREVALKMLRQKAQEDPLMVQRFEREAEICSLLSNPHTAKLHRFATAAETADYPETPYMAFDLVRGMSLGSIASFRHKLRPEEVAHVLAQMLESLEEAHQLGIIHRDIKPDNVLCVPPAGNFRAPQASGALFQVLGIPPISDAVWTNLSNAWIRVVDFGLGKMLEVDGRRVQKLTQTGMAAGTVAYMSPEQLKAQTLDHRLDIYACAMVMHRLLTGKDTFPGTTVPQVAMAHVAHPLPKLPEPLDEHPIAQVFARAGAKNPADRYVSAAEMAWELKAILDPELAAAGKPEFEPPPAVDEPRLTERLLRMLRGG